MLKIRDETIEGIVSKPECALQVMDGIIGCVLQDSERHLDLLTIRAHLAPTDDVPLLIGFSGLLDRARVLFSVKENEAYLEIA